MPVPIFDLLRMRFVSRVPLFTLLFCLPLLAVGQTLSFSDDVRTVTTLAANTTATLTGKAELHVTGTGDPMPNCVINLNSPDAWFFMEYMAPSKVASTFLSRVSVSGANAVLDSNVRHRGNPLPARESGVEIRGRTLDSATPAKPM